MQVFIIFGLGLGDNESQWEVCEVKLSKAAAESRVKELTDETGCDYKYEAFAAQ